MCTDGFCVLYAATGRCATTHRCFARCDEERAGCLQNAMPTWFVKPALRKWIVQPAKTAQKTAEYPRDASMRRGDTKKKYSCREPLKLF